jgi:hypothetical protein
VQELISRYRNCFTVFKKNLFLQIPISIATACEEGRTATGRSVLLQKLIATETLWSISRYFTVNTASNTATEKLAPLKFFELVEGN